jgi:hypothetical protein
MGNVNDCDCGAGWNKLIAISALVQDKAVEAILGMNQKHILFPCLGIF